MLFRSEVVCGSAAGQVIATLLAAVHDEPVGHAVAVEAGVAADLVRDVLEAHLVTDLCLEGQTQVCVRRGGVIL